MLKDLKIKSHMGIITAYLNINSIRDEFELLKCIIADNIDTLTIAETKLDLNFTVNQFLLEGLRPPNLGACLHGAAYVAWAGDAWCALEWKNCFSSWCACFAWVPLGVFCWVGGCGSMKNRH